MVMLLDSVAPLVNTISLGSAWMRSAICYTYMGTHDYWNCTKLHNKSNLIHDSIIITKSNITIYNQANLHNNSLNYFPKRLSIYIIWHYHLPSGLHGRLTLPAVRVCAGVRVPIEGHHVR